MVTNRGYIAERLDSIIANLEAGFRGIYGSDITIDPDTPDGQMIGLIAQAKADIEELGATIYKNLDADNAGGAWLELNVAYAGLRRKAASYSYLRGVILTGEPFRLIPAGSTIVDSNRQRWVIVSAATLNDLGSVRVDFRSADLGVYPLPVNSDFTIETVVLGWDKVSNPSPAEEGAEEERDSQLRRRFFRSRAQPSQNSVEAIEAKLESLPDVTEVVCLENTGDEVDENGLPRKSINVIVDGGNDEAIGDIIYHNKTAGAALMGETSVQIPTAKGVPVTIRFDRPIIVDCAARLTITRLANFTEIDTEAIKTDLSNTDFAIGEDVTNSRLFTPINQTQGFSIKSLEIGEVGQELTASDVVIGVRSKARFAVSDIEVLTV